jgi:hypothetical protein
MTMSFTTTESFTKTHARRLAAKVAADMHQCRQLYGSPAESSIEAYQDELVVMLAGQYLEAYEFGFETTDERRVVTWRYTVSSTGDLVGGRSGGLFAAADVSRAQLFNQRTPNAAWWGLSPAERERIEGQHSVRRVTKSGPTDGNGYWAEERVYDSGGGVAMTRKEFRPWQ